MKGVPAFTLNVTGQNLEGCEIEIDLVPCFQFDDCHWPDRVNKEYLPNPSTKKVFHYYLLTLLYPNRVSLLENLFGGTQKAKKTIRGAIKVLEIVFSRTRTRVNRK